MKRAFRQLAHLAHPDKGGEPRAFLELRAAYVRAVELVRARGQQSGGASGRS